MAILSKPCKTDNFESYNSLKLSFTNISGLRSNIFDCKYFLESNCPDILALCKINLDDSINCGNFFVFFFYQGFLSWTLTTHRTAGEGRGPYFIPLYHSHPLTNIQTFICNFACEMTITYF